ncbi:MAG: Mur ligase domain-containing protein, partial [Phycisphaerae bacterium]|nr:Mur ligase domain-containing protein [Phycisphaerae bacterium]
MPTALKKRQGCTVVEMDLKDVVEMVEGRLAGGRLEGCIGGVSTDTRSLQRGELFVALKGERFDGHDFLARAAEAGAAGVIISDRGKVPKDFAADVAVVEVDDTLQGLGRLAAGYRRRIDGKVIAITGSCGKTALKEMLGQVLCR